MSVVENSGVFALLAAASFAGALYLLLTAVWKATPGSAVAKRLASLYEEEIEEDQSHPLFMGEEESVRLFFASRLGMDVKGREKEYFWGLVAAAAMATATLVWMLVHLPLLLDLAVGAVGGYVVKGMVDSQKRAVIEQIEADLPEVYRLMGSLTAVPGGVPEMLETAAGAVSASGNDLLALVLMRLAADVRKEGVKAFREFEARTAASSPSLSALARQMARFSELGGATFSEAFGATAETIGEIVSMRVYARGKVNATMDAVKIMILAMAATIAMFARDPSFRAQLGSVTAMMVYAGVGVSMAVGYYFIRSMAEEVM